MATFYDLFAVLFIMLVIIAVTVNLMLVLVLTSKYHKRRFRDHLLISMSTCDILRILLTGPMEIRGLLKHSMSDDERSCIPIALFMYMLEFTSISHLYFVVFDRYVCTCKLSVALKLYLDRSTIYKCIALSYANGIVWAIMPVFGLGAYGFQVHNIQCGLIAKHDVNTKIYISLIMVFIYLVPFCAVFYSLYEIRAKLKHARTEEIVNFQGDNNRTRETFEHIHRDEKQFKLVLSLALTFMVTWFVYDLTLMEEIFNKTKPTTGSHLEIVVTFIGQSSSVVVPILTFYFYVDLQESFVKIYHLFVRKTTHPNTVNALQNTGNSSLA